MKRNYRRRQIIKIKILCHSAEVIDLLSFDLNIFATSYFMAVFLMLFCRLGAEGAVGIMSFS